MECSPGCKLVICFYFVIISLNHKTSYLCSESKCAKQAEFIHRCHLLYQICVISSLNGPFNLCAEEHGEHTEREQEFRSFLDVFHFHAAVPLLIGQAIHRLELSNVAIQEAIQECHQLLSHNAAEVAVHLGIHHLQNDSVLTRYCRAEATGRLGKQHREH